MTVPAAYGVGVDLIHLHRMQQVLETGGDYFLNRVFTIREQQEAARNPCSKFYYAKTFASKEAVFKALGTSWDGGGLFTDIEIETNPGGQPQVILHGPFQQLASKSTLHISISYDGEYAIAVAIMCPKG